MDVAAGAFFETLMSSTPSFRFLPTFFGSIGSGSPNNLKIMLERVSLLTTFSRRCRLFRSSGTHAGR